MGLPQYNEGSLLVMLLARTLGRVPRGLLLEIMAPAEHEASKPGGTHTHPLWSYFLEPELSPKGQKGHRINQKLICYCPASVLYFHFTCF